MNNYVHVIDNDGNRITSLVDDKSVLMGKEALIAKAKEIYPDATQYIYGDDDMLDEFLAGKIYKGGKFIDKPVVEPSPEEQQAKEAAQVASEYEAKFKALDDEIIRAEVIDKDTEYADELRQQREALQVEFMEKRGEL